MASVAACGLTGCGDDSKPNDSSQSCDEAQKPANALRCDCVNGAWEMCVYPSDNKCAKSNCGPGTVCDSDTGECVPSGGDKECKAADKTSDSCICNKKTGEWENCGSTDACDGKACKTAGTCADDGGVCKCNNGGDIANDCVVAADACEGKACKTANTCADDGGVCKCNNGGDIANNCVVAADACEGKACKTAGTCADNAGVCKCSDDKFTLDNDCKSACEGKSLPAKATKCSDCIEEAGTWNEATCEYPACTDDGNKTSTTCDCQKGEWTNCDFCKGKTLLVGQVCNSETGEVTYDPAPELIITGLQDSYGEDASVGGKKIAVTIKLNAQPSEDVVVNVTLDDPSLAELCNDGGAAKCFEIKPKTLTKDNYATGLQYGLRIKDNNQVGSSATLKVSHKATSTDSAFNELEADKTITIVDDDQPGIVLNCEKDLIQAAWKKQAIQNEGYDGYPRCDSGDVNYKQTCTVKLSSQPQNNVTVNITSESENSEILKPSAEYGGNYYNEFNNTTLIFTEDNYNQEQKIELYFTTPGYVDFSDTKSLKYTIKAKSDTSGYVVSEISKEFMVRPMTKYIYWPRNSSNGVRKVKLPKGKYRLHAWGASGGLATDTNMSADTSDGFKCTNHGGAGAYIRGDLTLTEPTTVYVYVGEAGKGNYDGCDPAYNGGGQGACSINYPAASGGGGTDFCIGHDDCKTLDTHWPYRILIAGGGGGGTAHHECYDSTSTSGGVGGSATWRDSTGYGSCLASHHCSGWSVGGRSTDFACTENPDPTKLGTSGYGVGASGGGVWNPKYYAAGGGGGGWYGGYYYSFDTSIGGGAGSSWAFKGTNASEDCNGKQVAKYALSNVNGMNGLAGGMIDFSFTDGDDNYFPFFKDTEVTGNENILCSKVMNFPNRDEEHVGNIGDGYAVIETLYDE